MNIFGIFILITLFGFLFSFKKFKQLMNKEEGEKKIKEISDLVHKGALSFLKTEYKTISVFAIIIAIILFFINYVLAICFLFGAFVSSLVAYVGMYVSTKANVRTVTSAKKSLKDALDTSFSSGLVTSIFIVSIGLIGIIILFSIFKDVNLLFGFGFGASLVALFLRVGGGVFTKAADVGADLVGKVEKGIPEDDPRNPAVIADNVGDNVGDVAGMGSDLLESYIQSIIAAMVLGFLAFGNLGLILPLFVCSVGVLASVFGSFFVNLKNQNIYSAINKGFYSAFLFMVFVLFFVVLSLNKIIYNSFFVFGPNSLFSLFFCVVLGLLSGIIISKYTLYVTSADKKPTRSIAESSKTGAATNILKGLSVGMFSTALPIIVVSISIIFSYSFGGHFGVALSSVGLLGILGIVLAADFYGPVVDNAQGLVEMGGLSKKIQERTERLDAVGNSTAAITKGFAIASAAFTSIALFISYIVVTNISTIDLINVNVIVSIFIGAMVPFVFCSFLIEAVESAAFKIIHEVRRQFKSIKGLMSKKQKPDYDACISICTNQALKGMLLPAIIAIVLPVLIALLLGPEAVGGFLAGAIGTGFVLAIFMANSGGAWDNSKKYIEQGNLGGKGSEAHKAAVVGDTVGDPFKDTCGPSLNILIKLMTIVALVFVPLLI